MRGKEIVGFFPESLIRSEIFRNSESESYVPIRKITKFQLPKTARRIPFTRLTQNIMEQAKDDIKTAASNVKDAASNAAGAARDKIHTATEPAEPTMGEKVSAAAGKVKDAAIAAKDSVIEKVHNATSAAPPTTTTTTTTVKSG